MKIHPRLFNVQKAHAEIGMAIVKVAEKHDLTPLEVQKCVLQCALEWNTIALRHERHPDDPTGNRKADEA